MRYFFAIVLPPLGILMCKRYGHFAINLFFWLLSIPLLFFFGIGIFVWLGCVVQAVAVCKVSSLDKRIDRVVKAIETRNQVQVIPTPAAEQPTSASKT